MTVGPIALKRSHVLGELYSRCDRSESTPVYLEEKTEEAIGHADESMGVFADAFLFHLPEDICKKLSTSYYQFAFNYDFSGETTREGKRIKLNYILLITRTTGLPRRSAKGALTKSAAEPAALEPEPVK
jgi:hypothetical protein